MPGQPIRNFGYLFLSDSKPFTQVLQQDQHLQADCGAGTHILSADEIMQKYPLFYVDDIDSGSLNAKDEGSFNAVGTVEWMRKSASENGVDYIDNEVVKMTLDGSQVQSVTLRSGENISVNNVVNAAGTRAAQVSRMAGIDLPIEARRRYTYIFSVDDPLPQDLPLTIDSSGVHLRSYGPDDYLVGFPPTGPDVAVDVDDISFAENAWEEKILPIITRRIPQFSTARVTNSWMGHYEFNTFDHNAIIGPHNNVKNLLYCVGFSGHGSQQAPLVGEQWLN